MRAHPIFALLSLCAANAHAGYEGQRFEFWHPTERKEFWVTRIYFDPTIPDDTNESREWRKLSIDARAWSYERLAQKYPAHASYLMTTKRQRPSESFMRQSSHFILSEKGDPRAFIGTLRKVYDRPGDPSLPIDGVFPDWSYERPKLQAGNYPLLSPTREGVLWKTAVFGGTAQLMEIASTEEFSVLPLLHYFVEFDQNYREDRLLPQAPTPEAMIEQSANHPVRRAMIELGVLTLEQARSRARENQPFSPVHVSQYILYCPDEMESDYTALGFKPIRGAPRENGLLAMVATRKSFIVGGFKRWKSSRLFRSLIERGMTNLMATHTSQIRSGFYQASAIKRHLGTR